MATPEPSPAPLNPRLYNKLKSDLARQLERTRQTGPGALNEVRNHAYWRIGSHLNAQPRLQDDTIARLARDLGQSPLLLYRTSQFHKAWPRGLAPATRRLSWTHHIEIINISDATRRKFYLAQCLENGWTRDTLRRAVRKDYYSLARTGRTLHEQLAPKDKTPYHIYRAIPERIIDGDTLELRIDLGFRNWTNQVIRLRGINTAELNALPETADRAHRAKAFLAARLQGVTQLTIKTYKTDLYGRYVADVFYQPVDGAADTAVFLNKELLDSGLAVAAMV